MRKRLTKFLSLSLFVSLVQINVAPISAQAVGNTIYTISYGGGLKARPLDGTGTQYSVGSVSQSIDIAAKGSYIYLSFGGIKRINSDGTGLTTLRSVSGQMGLFIDGSYIYYGYEYGRTIGRMNLDGTGANDAFLDYSSFSSAPYSAQVLVIGSTIYFGGGANKTGKSIWKIPITGGTPTLFVNDADASAGVGNIATDGTYLYWTDFRAGEVGKAALDGSSTNDNFITGLNSPWGIEYVSGYLYYTNSSFIGKAKSDGTATLNTWVTNSGTQGLAVADAGQFSAVDSTPPLFTSADTFSVAENTTSIGTISTNESSTFSISGGEDSAKFQLLTSSETSTALSFIAAPNYEAPTDVGSNNSYIVVLKALDSASNAGYETVTVTVTDVADIADFNSIGLSNGLFRAVFRTTTTINVNVVLPSKITFSANGKRIAGCIKIPTSGVSPNIVATCSWKPSTRGSVKLSATSFPNNQSFASGSSSTVNIVVSNRTGTK